MTYRAKSKSALCRHMQISVIIREVDYNEVIQSRRGVVTLRRAGIGGFGAADFRATAFTVTVFLSLSNFNSCHSASFLLKCPRSI